MKYVLLMRRFPIFVELNLNQVRELVHPFMLARRGLSQHSSYYQGENPIARGWAGSLQLIALMLFGNTYQ
jgi:hypothetical protein